MSDERGTRAHVVHEAVMTRDEAGMRLLPADAYTVQGLLESKDTHRPRVLQ